MKVTGRSRGPTSSAPPPTPPAASATSDPPGTPATREEVRADAPPLPKTSPVPGLGDVVLYRTTDKAKQFNGSDLHPALVTRVWKHEDGRISCLNLLVLPDCGEPYMATSSPRISAAAKASGWFTKGEEG